jgi:hypothetical protein
MPDTGRLRDLKRDAIQISTPRTTRPETPAVAAAALSRKNTDSIPRNDNSNPTVGRGQYVQASTATRKKQWTLGWMGVGIGTVGLFIMFC